MISGRMLIAGGIAVMAGTHRGVAPGHQGDTVAPKIQIEPETLDLGHMRQGRIVDGAFVVRNVGTAVLEIEGLRPSCGCTTPKLQDDQRSVPPGGQTEIRVYFDSKGRRGVQSKIITVLTNDPNQPRSTVTVRADVEPLYRLVPANGHVQGHRMRRGKAVGPTLDLLPEMPDATLELEALDLPTGDLVYTEEALLGAEGRTGARLRFTVTPDAALQNLEVPGIATVRVSDESADVSFRVVGRIVGDLTFRPPVIYAGGTTRRGRELPRITVKAEGTAKFRVVDVDAGPYLEAQVVEASKRREFVVHLTLRPETPDGPLGQTVTLHTDLAGEPVIDVPVFVNVAPRVTCNPRIVVLKGDPEDDLSSRKVRVEAERGETLDMFGLSCDLPYVRAEVADPAVRRWPNLRFVRVWLTPDRPSGEHQGRLLIRTNIEGAESVEVPVVVRDSPAGGPAEKESR